MKKKTTTDSAVTAPKIAIRDINPGESFEAWVVDTRPPLYKALIEALNDAPSAVKVKYLYELTVGATIETSLSKGEHPVSPVLALFSRAMSKSSE